MFQQRNPSVWILLTVSPVPLIATFEKEHVHAADRRGKLGPDGRPPLKSRRLTGTWPTFPRNEIVTGSFNRGRYFAEDLRQVTEVEVDHVMRCFLHHYGAVPAESAASATERFRAEASAAMDVVCDEEEIDVRTAQ